MSLTGSAFFYLLILATVLAVAGTLVAWGLVRGPRPLRWAVRLLMIVVCQLTAISIVAVWINNSYGLYTSWSDLLGEEKGGAVAAGSGTSGPVPAMPGPPPSRAMFTRTGNGLLETYVHGKYSKLSGQVLVWTPPQYDQPQYRTMRFPVMMLLHGVPGSPQSWAEGGGMPGTLAQMMAAGTVKPAIVVMPVIDPGGGDTDCSDTPVRKNATWLVKDVPELIETQFRALNDARGWGLIGFSTGGLCSVKLAMQYPNTFASAVGMDPDPLSGDPSVLKDAQLRQANSPMWLARQKPAVSLMLATSAKDRYSPVSNITDFAKVVQWPTDLAAPEILPSGGHNWNTWQRLFPTVFPWLSAHLDDAQVVTPPVTHQTPPVLRR
ncbi:alpha/beta hydrolase [Streptacidiphilus sp. EB129]|uniref:alpha/beta hydrolase n=1 Tax=Streptacidiphilus sp. EB129 TaxID=3156262 RepID=UPI003512884F